MAVCRISEERTLAHQQARRRSQTVSGPRGNAISISGSSRVLRRGLGERHVLGSRGSTRRLRTGLPLGVCSCWRCSRDSCIPSGQTTQEIIHIHSFAFLGFGSCRCVAQTSTVPQSHSSPGSRKAFPQTGPPKMRLVEGESCRQAGLTSSRNLSSCCWLQLLNSWGYTNLGASRKTA